MAHNHQVLQRWYNSLSVPRETARGIFPASPPLGFTDVGSAESNPAPLPRPPPPPVTPPNPPAPKPPLPICSFSWMGSGWNADLESCTERGRQQSISSWLPVRETRSASAHCPHHSDHHWSVLQHLTVKQDWGRGQGYIDPTHSYRSRDDHVTVM